MGFTCSSSLLPKTTTSFFVQPSQQVYVNEVMVGFRRDGKEGDRATVIPCIGGMKRKASETKVHRRAMHPPRQVSACTCASRQKRSASQGRTSKAYHIPRVGLLLKRSCMVKRMQHLHMFRSFSLVQYSPMHSLLQEFLA